ncbi:hypothetical protein C5C59_16345 [Rathayibacter sp. AY1F4]|nr:hypothetical protein C5C26_14780 [Rathayibacter sp. AY2B1]PPG66393.1 hypothetical protein C5C59_16345 [Rathayibacter sp. AY1F4]
MTLQDLADERTLWLGESSSSRSRVSRWFEWRWRVSVMNGPSVSAHAPRWRCSASRPTVGARVEPVRESDDSKSGRRVAAPREARP